VRITIHVRPGSVRDEIGGSHAGALIVRVRARAEKGRATAAALTVVARALDVRQRDVKLVAGSTSRTKIVEIPDAAAARVARLLQDRPGRLN
jgi:uncharacterized protein YggU (UPF0235/DUF167 family)